MPTQKKASGTSKTAATKKKAAAAPAKATTEAPPAEAKPAKTTKTTTKQAAPAPATDEKKTVAKTKVADNQAAPTAESNKPVATEQKKVAPAAPTKIVSEPKQPKPQEPNFERDTFEEKGVEDLNAENQAMMNQLAGLNDQDGDDVNDANEQKRISDLTKQQKLMIRSKRFGDESYANVDPNQILTTIQSENLKRQERAQKFGLGDTAETTADKRKERMNRFKAEQQGGGSKATDEDKEKQAARLARFGELPGNEGQKKEKRGPLQFTLDEYNPKDKAGGGGGKFLKKRHHGNPGQKPQNSNNFEGKFQGNKQGNGGQFKKRFNKGNGQGPPQQGSNKFRNNSFKRAKHF